MRVHCENRYYFKQAVTRVVRMAYQPHQATLQLLFYDLKVEVLLQPQKATGRNHTKRLKCDRERREEMLIFLCVFF